jgi:hypothetical protein
MTTLNSTDWELVYDFQRTDSWDKKSVTVKVYNSKTNLISQAIVLDDMTKKTKKRIFRKETCESDAMRWASNICNEIMFAK